MPRVVSITGPHRTAYGNAYRVRWASDEHRKSDPTRRIDCEKWIYGKREAARFARLIQNSMAYRKSVEDGLQSRTGSGPRRQPVGLHYRADYQILMRVSESGQAEAMGLINDPDLARAIAGMLNEKLLGQCDR